MKMKRLCLLLPVVLFCSITVESRKKTTALHSISIHMVNVPNYGVQGNDAVLTCYYDSQGNQIYSIKWYKNGKEFFSYLPGRSRPISVHNLRGVNVDITQSDQNRVRLRSLSLASTGRYRCEVSIGAPTFATDSDYGDLLVVVVPIGGPVIEGVSDRYDPKQRLNVNCSTSESKPPANLTWYINYKPVPEQELIRYPITNLSHSPENLHRTTLGLRHVITRSDFSSMHSMKLKCAASIYDAYYKTTEVTVHVATITSVTPLQLQRTTARTLNLVIENLPSSPGRLLCTFTAIGKTLSNGFATRTENGVSCTTPRNDLLPSIPYGESHFTSKLSVRMLDGPEYAATNFTFFDCNSFSSCTSCVSSLFPCDWCVDGHRCTHDTAENCRNDILVSGINTFGPRIRSGPSFCPRINSTVEGSSEVLVASGLTKSIQVKVEHIAFFIIQSRFVCQFNIEGRVTSVNAQLLKDTIYCDEMEFIYTSRNRANITATFAVIWGGSKPLDNPENIHVVIYKCDEMAKDCGTCLIQDDKYKCGWCQAEEGCQVEAQCGRGGESWLDQHQSCGEQQIAGDNITAGTHDRNLEDISPHEAVHVATITSVTPHQLQRTTARTLNLVIENLPSSPGRLLCTFTAIGKTLSNGFATRTATGVSCTTPRNDLWPLIPHGESHFMSKLSVRMLDGPEYAATNFTVFDCNSFSSCTSCVSSLFPCDWCVDGHRCTHDTAENCRNDILVTGINRFGPSIRSGPRFCPRINSTVEGSPEVLVASGLTKSIQVKVDHIAQFIIQTRFVCQFNIEGRVTSVNAQLLKDTIYCDEMEFIYTSRNRANITATFAVIWGGLKPLDNPDNIHVVIYKCDEMAKDCGTCLILDDKYKCGWCQAEEGCQVEAQCGRGGESWLDQHQSCGEQQIAGDNITVVTHDRNLEDISPHEAGYLKIVEEFSNYNALSDEEDPIFNNLVVDKNKGTVYIGAVNKIYQLSPNLELMDSDVTGPEPDSPHCSVLPDCPPSVQTKLTNNVNKALVIDYSDSRLITCGSLFQGTCTIRSLKNISNIFQIREPVVANDDTSSTVAFIAPGPPNPPITQVLYVGVTYTGKGAYRSEVPAVSSRSLDSSSLFQTAQTAVTTGTRMYVNSLARERYPINYIYGFSSEGFSYFLTTQMRKTSPSSYQSKLVRVCHDDSDYYSYTEIPIQCIAGPESSLGPLDYSLVQAAHVGKPGSDLAAELGVTAQDDVLFAVFSTPQSSEASKPSNNSALCVYSLKSIRSKFTSNIQKCFNGEGESGLNFIQPSLRCINTKLTQIGEDFCGLDVNTPLGGELPITKTPALVFNAHLTSVTATSTGDFTVAFIGTSDGHLKKAVIESSTSGIEYADIAIAPGTSVKSDIPFDLTRDHVYVLTDKKLSKVRVEDCQQYTDCNTCLGAKDPYCGWCSLENKCSLRGDCRSAALDPLNWKSYKSGEICTTITSVTPHELQRTTARTLNLVIENLPTLPGQFLCAFTAIGKTLTTNATRTATGVSCTTPRTDLLPLAPYGESHFTSKLSVRMLDGPDFVATNFTFFDCNTYSSCTSCVTSLYPCDWCVDGHRCTHDTAENCRNDILVTGINRIGPSIRSGPAFCPRINATAGGSPEILVPSGFQDSIRVKVDNIAQFILQTRFVCQFNIEGRVTSVNAQLLSDTIYCDDMEFSYTSRNRANITATFAVIWGGSKPLDNPENIHVVIYKCDEMAKDCGTCLILDHKYKCGWCQAEEGCQVEAQCGRGGASWLDQHQSCGEQQIAGDNITAVTNDRNLEDISPHQAVCNCFNLGSVGDSCNDDGVCTCKPNLGGDKCDECAPGTFNFPRCEGCYCENYGSVGDSCNDDGVCTCKPNFMGDKCEMCAPDTFNFPLCEECNCNPAGVVEDFWMNGGCYNVKRGELCTCKETVEGRTCSRCAPNFFGFPNCKPCSCPSTATCDKQTGECI